MTTVRQWLLSFLAMVIIVAVAAVAFSPIVFVLKYVLMLNIMHLGDAAKWPITLVLSLLFGWLFVFIMMRFARLWTQLKAKWPEFAGQESLDRAVRVFFLTCAFYSIINITRHIGVSPSIRKYYLYPDIGLFAGSVLFFLFPPKFMKEKDA